MSQPHRRPSVLLADDNPGIQTAVVRLLSPSCDVVGCVGEIATLFEAVDRLRPDVVLLDLSLPGDMNSLDACRRLATLTPAVQVVVFTAHDDPILRRLFHDGGAAAFVSKLDAAPDLAAIVRGVVGV